MINGFMNNLKNNRGLTLIEIIAAVSIMGLVMAALFSVFHGSLQTFASSHELEDMRQRQSQLDFVVRELRGCAFEEIEITGPDDENVIECGSKSFQLDGNTIIYNGVEIISGVESFSAEKKGNYISIETVFKDSEDNKTVRVNVYPRIGSVEED